MDGLGAGGTSSDWVGSSTSYQTQTSEAAALRRDRRRFRPPQRERAEWRRHPTASQHERVIWQVDSKLHQIRTGCEECMIPRPRTVGSEGTPVHVSPTTRLAFSGSTHCAVVSKLAYGRLLYADVRRKIAHPKRHDGHIQVHCTSKMVAEP
jgi:hypothetical protein